MQHARGRDDAREVKEDNGGLHNITDVIRGIRYPVSATDTV